VRASTIVMIGFAAVFGLIAMFIAQSWLSSQADEQRRNLQAGQKPTSTKTIVVAKEPLRFASELAADKLAEVPWPADAVPAGAFASIAELMKGGTRLVLSPIEINEPVLTLKLTGPGERATLSALVQPGKKAVTVRVNDVDGVGGFVMPGDRVDIVLTRQIDKGNATTDVVLQNIRVLAIDQSADVRSSKPLVAKAVTVEVDLVEAQKLSLSSSVGTLSLLLRKAGEQVAEGTRRITLDDIFKNFLPAAGSAEQRAVTVAVTRGSKREEYSVPKEGTKEGTKANAVVGLGAQTTRQQ
jgi:pilus assembly protein CpaB